MSEQIELFRMTTQQKQAWVAIMGNANYPGSSAEMRVKASAMWASIKEHDVMRAFELFNHSQALGLYDAANDPVFGVDWEAEQT